MFKQIFVMVYYMLPFRQKLVHNKIINNHPHTADGYQTMLCVGQDKLCKSFAHGDFKSLSLDEYVHYN